MLITFIDTNSQTPLYIHKLINMTEEEAYEKARNYKAALSYVLGKNIDYMIESQFNSISVIH